MGHNAVFFISLPFVNMEKEEEEGGGQEEEEEERKGWGAVY